MRNCLSLVLLLASSVSWAADVDTSDRNVAPFVERPTADFDVQPGEVIGLPFASASLGYTLAGCKAEPSLNPVYSATGLPGSASLNPTTGILTGTWPVSPGGISVTFTCTNDLGTASDSFVVTVLGGGGPVTSSAGGTLISSAPGAAGTSTRNAEAYDDTIYVVQNKHTSFLMGATNDDIDYINTEVSTSPSRMSQYRVGARGQPSEGVHGTTPFSSWNITSLPSNGTVYAQDGTEITTVPTSAGARTWGYYVPDTDYTGTDCLRYNATDSTGTSDEGTICFKVEDTASWTMPLGWPDNLSDIWGFTEEPSLPSPWTSEVADYAYIDADDPSCSNSQTTGSVSTPLCSFRANFGHNSTFAGKAIKLAPKADGTCYELADQGTVRQTFSGGTQSTPFFLMGDESLPPPLQPCITTDLTRTGPSIWGLNGSNIILAGVRMENVRVSHRGSSEDLVDDDGYVMRHGACNGISSTAGNCFAPGGANDNGQVLRSGAFNVQGIDNGFRDATFANEYDVHFLGFGNSAPGYVLNVQCHQNGGDCFQATQNNNNGHIFISRMRAEGDSENCIDIKAHRDVTITENYCMNTRVVRYTGGSGGNGNAIVLNDDDASGQFDQILVMNNRVLDVNGPGIECAIVADTCIQVGNIVVNALGSSGTGIHVRNSGATSGQFTGFNTVVNATRGMHPQTSGGAAPSNTNFGWNAIAGSVAYNQWMLNVSNYRFNDKNYYEADASTGVWQCCSNSSPIDRVGIAAWRTASSSDANGVANATMSFRRNTIWDVTPETGSSLIGVVTESQVNTDVPGFLAQIRSELGITDIPDVYGNTLCEGGTCNAGAVQAVPAPTAAVKPSAATTGPDLAACGGSLTPYTGPFTITTPGTVLECFSATTTIRPEANNITLRNGLIDGGRSITDGIDAVADQVYTGILIENVEIKSANGSAINGRGFTLRNVHMWDIGADCVRGKGDILIEDSLCEKIGFITDSHADGIQYNNQFDQSKGLTIRRTFWNTLYAPDEPGYKGSLGVFFNTAVTPINNILIENNWFNGGNKHIQFSAKKNGPPTNVIIRNNIHGPIWRQGTNPISKNTSSGDIPDVIQCGNRYESTGELLQNDQECP